MPNGNSLWMNGGLLSCLFIVVGVAYGLFTNKVDPVTDNGQQVLKTPHTLS